MKLTIFIFFFLTLTTTLTAISITFTGNSYFSDSKIFQLLGRQPDDQYQLEDLEPLIADVVNLYLSRGFLFASVQLQEIKLVNDLLIAIIGVDEGVIIKAENFVFRGNKVTRDNILMRESRIQKGQVITKDVINLAERRINNKRFITSNNVLPINTNTVLINVEEAAMTRFSAILGYSSSKKVQKKVQGFVTVDLLNLMGTDRDIGFVWRSYNEKDTASIKYHESGPVNVPLTANLMLYREEVDSTYVKTEMGGDLAVDFFTQKAGLSLNLLYIYPQNESNVIKQEERMLGAFYGGNFTDDQYNPTEGWDFYLHQYLILVDKEKQNFNRYRTDARVAYYQPFSSRFTLANSVTLTHLQNKSLTEYDLIWVGGTFSIRGFFEDTYAGNNVIYTNTELRYLLTKTSRIFAFIDYGYVEDNRVDFHIKYTDLVGLGIGLRVQTRIGLLRMDYGFHYAEGEWSNPLDPMVHFGIETEF